MQRRGISLLLSIALLLGLFGLAAPRAEAASDMKTSDECIALIKKLEGFSKYPYYDYGHWTVGYGTACPSEDQERYEADGITEAEADALMREYLDDFESSLNRFISNNALTLNQYQYDALISFTYNLGANWMNNSSNFRTAVIEGYTGNDFIAAISRWCTANGEILTNLVKRRLLEANLYLNGVYDSAPPEYYRYVIYNTNLEDAVTDVLVQGYDTRLTDTVRATASKSGYIFQGWFTQSSGGTRITKLDDSVTVTTLYAQWQTESGETVEQDPEEKVVATGTVTADKLNVRSGAGTSYEKVGALYQGDRVSITEIKTAGSARWGKISKGWICLDYVKLDETQSEPEDTKPEETEPAETEPAEKEPDETEPAEPKQDTVIATGKVVNCSSLRIRSGPGTNYSKVGTLDKGTRVEIFETTTVSGKVWGRISAGWICVTGYVALDTTDNTESTTGTTGTVTCNSLNIRAGAGTGYAKVGSLSKGQKVEILETTKVGSATWGRISQGWIHMGYIRLDNGTTSGSSSGSSTGNNSVRTGVVTGTDELRIRSGPGTSYSKVGTLKRGTKVTILETQKVGSSTWGRIDKGWISLRYVNLDEEIVGSTKTVTAKSLNIRKEPGTSSAKVGSYTKGNKVVILETATVGKTIWGRTDRGWISMDYVS